LFASRRIEVIPNGLDTEVFKPMPRPVARASRYTVR
jgi:glycosyltransferase involved in cell wall biosynthesis